MTSYHSFTKTVPHLRRYIDLRHWTSSSEPLINSEHFGAKIPPPPPVAAAYIEWVVQRNNNSFHNIAQHSDSIRQLKKIVLRDCFTSPRLDPSPGWLISCIFGTLLWWMDLLGELEQRTVPRITGHDHNHHHLQQWRHRCSWRTSWPLTVRLNVETNTLF